MQQELTKIILGLGLATLLFGSGIWATLSGLPGAKLGLQPEDPRNDEDWLDETFREGVCARTQAYFMRGPSRWNRWDRAGSVSEKLQPCRVI
jgi:hypothetical protein